MPGVEPEIQRKTFMKTPLASFISWMGSAGAVLLLQAGLWANAAAVEPTRLIVRADDIGSFHSANLACIQSYREGIARSVELMVPCAWFPEAVRLLKENPGFDVGVHLVLTSEWENIKWRPLTHAASLVDSDGYFFPMVWPNPNLPPKSSLKECSWKLEEVERELRAQIETALRHLPRISHLSTHMGFTSLDASLGELVKRLAKEYRLELEGGGERLKRFPGWNKAESAEERIEQFVKNLEKLEPGTYVFVEHPGLDGPEMRAVGHKGYEEVAADRDAVTRVFTSPAVREAIRSKGIQLLSFKDLAGGGVGSWTR
jgi:predicted glycoside hydrolase/deacetylase ChbG (UPF0249 family)